MFINDTPHHTPMYKVTCEICGKEIEGFTQNHAESMLEQHKIKHKREEKTKINN